MTNPPSTELVVRNHDPLTAPDKPRPVFERITEITPAYDCLINQPCQLPELKGARPCHPANSHGRHNAELVFTLRSAIADISLTVYTGWHLPETPTDKTLGSVVRRDLPLGMAVNWHSVLPSHEGQKPVGWDSECPRWPGRACYADTGYTLAEEPAKLLVRKGSDAVWAWLEKLHTATFGGR